MTYLAFRETRDTGKTKVWAVENSNDGSYLGRAARMAERRTPHG